MESYSQCGQDLFVISLIKDKGSFLDLGCYLPKKINNTYLLEMNGWTGLSIDINDYSNEWQVRKTPFIRQDCFSIDYKYLLPEYFSHKTIDYLSLDMEILGERYKLLETVLNTGYEFKIITIEHDSYLGEKFINNEKIPQRDLLNKFGYKLIFSDVSQQKHPHLNYEDWWINPKYFEVEQLEGWYSELLSCDQIFNKKDIPYIINEISMNW